MTQGQDCISVHILVCGVRQPFLFKAYRLSLSNLSLRGVVHHLWLDNLPKESHNSLIMTTRRGRFGGSE